MRAPKEGCVHDPLAADCHAHGYRISASRPAYKREKGEVHIEKLDLTDAAMGAVVRMYCQLNCLEVVPVDISDANDNGQAV
jgi:hypothetical protein